MAEKPAGGGWLHKGMADGQAGGNAAKFDEVAYATHETGIW